MIEPNKQPIDPRQLAKDAKVVIQPAATTKQIKMPARVQGLSTLPKPTDNPPPKPETIQGPKVEIKEPQAEVKKIDETIPQGNQNVEKAEKRDEKGRFIEGNIPTGHRPKKLHSVDAHLEIEATKAYALQPDGTTLTKAQYLAKIMMDKALEGNVKLIEIVSNRLDGKAMQKIQVVAPEDAEGTVLSAEAEAKLEALFGRGK